MTERIQKLISAAGLMSRRAAEEAIAAGRVEVNGEKAGLGDRADPAADRITVDGKELPRTEEKLYLMLNKPRGYVTTLRDERGRKTVAQLVSSCGYHVYPVGRLDMESDGLLLLTNDGELANRLCHPSGEKTKIYRVRVQGYSDALGERLTEPMTIDGYALRPVRVRPVETGGDEAVLDLARAVGNVDPRGNFAQDPG